MGIFLLWLMTSGPVMFGQAAHPPREEYTKAIEDNSFFVEEAYNQEEGIVQHISNLQYLFTREKDLQYTFTQEWPLGSRNHQLSFTAPLSLSNTTHPGGISDILVNYRYQLVDKDGWANVAPRLSVILPTGRVRSGLGAGTTGIQINIPVSRRLSESFVAHLNAGLTYVPNMKDESGPSRTLRHTFASFSLGASLIWLTAENMNLMFEYSTNVSSDAFATGTTERSTDIIVSPGVRWAINMNTLQIVPGIGIPLMIGNGSVRAGAFFYLSFEHPF